MPHDRNSKLLAEGDIVHLPCVITQISPGEGRGCNLTLQAIEPNDDSTEYHPVLAANSRSVFKQEHVRPAYQQRVIDEHSELRAKALALTAFLDKRTGNLPPDEEPRMRKQLELMNAYADVLSERIANFVF